MAIDVKLLGQGDERILASVASGVFDDEIKPELTREFLGSNCHHLVVAIDGDLVVGFASAVHYVHPDKPRELWVDEVGVAPSHRGRGVAKKLLSALFEVGREIGCAEAWVLTDRQNQPAMRLYSSLGGKEDPKENVMFTFRLSDADSQAGCDRGTTG